MCGIAGIIARSAVNPEALTRMAGLQIHRGPDERNTWIDERGRVGFAHTRLSILDLSPGGRQPMRHPSGDTVLCFNGEIYNYRELAARLREEGVELTSQSDTEVLLAAYRAWGDACLNELNGMFAFALYDAARRRLVCARDRFGEKPFLFSAQRDFFAFASEYKALLALSEISDRPDIARAMKFMVWNANGLDDERQTVFPDIRQLLPGERLILDTESLEADIGRYWTLTPATGAPPADLPEAAAQFRDLLADSVQLRLRSDVPVGSCLSGGLDSGSIVCLARRHLGADAPYHTFSGRFPGTNADEGPYIDEVASANHTITHTIEPSPRELVDELAAFLWHNELPVSSSSQYAQWCVFRKAREEGIIVLLDGQGGDELLGGYEQYFRTYCAEADVTAQERGNIGIRYPMALPSARQRFSESLPAGVRMPISKLLGLGSNFLYGVSGALAKRAAQPPQAVENPYGGLKGALFNDAFHTVLPTLLRYGDRNSMAHSVEVRLPFCDHRIAEFVFSLPPEYLMGGMQTKRILREAMRGILPEPVRTRWNKQGFVPPQTVWLRRGLLESVEACINDPAFRYRGYWNPSWWHKAVARFRAGDDSLAAPLWKVFVADAWQRHFIERVQSQDKVPALKTQGREAA
ncbi:MAG: asparagine synthase (glutamine-hydrolyzing) [Rhodospirillales bacterium]